MGHGAWGMGENNSELLTQHNTQCLTPNAQYPIPNAQCPMPIYLKYVPDEKSSAATAHFPVEITICKGNFGQLLHATITRMPKNASVSAIAAISAPSDR
ncbi:hypothetical protein [Nostoc commune]|uniref:hypothetical protein n=1 Tax=Nostoc commune TaxID=1178 RepID=UPI001FD2EB2A|nr:hypothetical protein [Nostoc commune]